MTSHDTPSRLREIMNFEQAPCPFCIRKTKLWQASVSCPSRKTGWRVLTPSAIDSTPSLGAPSPLHQPLVTAREMQISSSTTWCHQVPQTSAQTSQDWFIPAWQRLVQTVISHSASSCPFPGGFQPAFSCLFYYWVRGQLCRVGSLLPPLHVYQGLNSGHQTWMPGTFTPKSSGWPQLFFHF